MCARAQAKEAELPECWELAASVCDKRELLAARAQVVYGLVSGLSR